MGAPTVTPLVENRREGGFVVYDPSDGMFTREPGFLLAGAGICVAGLVLAASLTAGVAVAAPLGANTGNGAFGAIVAGAAAKPGVYAVEFDDATHFIVNDPTGIEVGHGTVGQAFAGGGLGFTITAGGTAFAASDSFTITVTGTTRYVPYDPTSVTGAAVAAAILWSGYRDATAVDRRAVLNVRGRMKVQAAELIWGPNVTTDAHRTIALQQLARLGILSV